MFLLYPGGSALFSILYKLLFISNPKSFGKLVFIHKVQLTLIVLNCYLQMTGNLYSEILPNSDLVPSQFSSIFFSSASITSFTGNISDSKHECFTACYSISCVVTLNWRGLQIHRAVYFNLISDYIFNFQEDISNFFKFWYSFRIWGIVSHFRYLIVFSYHLSVPQVLSKYIFWLQSKNLHSV